jgi:hypothetical protein
MHGLDFKTRGAVHESFATVLSRCVPTKREVVLACFAVSTPASRCY